MKKSLLNYAFFTTGPFGKIIVHKLITSSLKPSLIVTTNQKHLQIKKNNLPPIIEIQKITKQQDKIIDSFQIFKINLVLLSDFGQIIPSKILSYPKYKFLNIHPSLLPRWRGATPIQSAILANDAFTGITIILMNEKIDEGNIVAQSKPIKILPNDTYLSLQKKLANIGYKLLLKTVPLWIKGLIKTKPQPKNGVTLCHKLKKTDGQIIWAKYEASRIIKMIKAYYPYPSVYTFIKKGEKLLRLQILQAKETPPQNFPNSDFGSIHISSQNRLFVNCAHNTILEILKIKPESKKTLSIKEFINGYRPYLTKFC